MNIGDNNAQGTRPEVSESVILQETGNKARDIAVHETVERVKK